MLQLSHTFRLQQEVTNIDSEENENNEDFDEDNALYECRLDN